MRWLGLLLGGLAAAAARAAAPNLDSAYETERLMVLRFTDTNAAWLAPRGARAVVLALGAATPLASPEVRHFLRVTHALRRESFAQGVPTGLLEVERYPEALRHLAGASWRRPRNETVALLLDPVGEGVAASISFLDPAEGAERLAERLGREEELPPPSSLLLGEEPPLLSRVCQKNASVALLSPSAEDRRAHARAAEECAGVAPGSQGGVVDRARLGELSRRDFLCRYAFPGRPVLFAATEEAAACRWWTPQWLAASFPEAVLEGGVDMGIEGWHRTGPLRLAEYVGRATNASDPSPPPWSVPYAFFSLGDVADPATGARFQDRMMPETPPLFAHNWLGCLPPRCQREMAMVFVAGRGARQSNHQDHFATSKWQTQCHGRKRWILHPPELSPQLYHGRVDPFAPDHGRYPLYREALGERLEVVVEPGETLWWPAGWWHATQALTDGVALARNMVDEHNFASFREAVPRFCGEGGGGGSSSYCRGILDHMPRFEAWYEGWRREGLRPPPCHAGE